MNIVRYYIDAYDLLIDLISRYVLGWNFRAIFLS